MSKANNPEARNKMKILFAADVFPDPNSGAAGTEYQTIQALRRLGHEVDEIWADDLPHKITHGNLHYLLELPGGFRDAIRRKWDLKKYDVIHANQGHSYLAALEHLKQRRPGVFVCRSHGLDDHMEIVLKKWRKQLGIRNRNFLKSIPGFFIDKLLFRHDRLAAKYASGYIVSSSLDREFLINYHRMQPERVACIPQAPPSHFIKTPVSEFSPERLKRILYVGGFAYWKAPQTVAAVANEIFQKTTDATLTWVCMENDHSAVLSLLTPNAREHTRLIGWVSQEELLRVYDENGIFICPSLFDGFAKVFLEAMARGLSVIATRTGGMYDIIKDGENGYHVDFNDSVAISSRIKYLQENYTLAKEISASARDTACEYSWDRVARETVAFYERLLSLPKR